MIHRPLPKNSRDLPVGFDLGCGWNCHQVELPPRILRQRVFRLLGRVVDFEWRQNHGWECPHRDRTRKTTGQRSAASRNSSVTSAGRSVKKERRFDPRKFKFFQPASVGEGLTRFEGITYHVWTLPSLRNYSRSWACPILLFNIKIDVESSVLTLSINNGGDPRAPKLSPSVKLIAFFSAQRTDDSNDNKFLLSHHLKSHIS